jgi:hypothetical protein
MENNNNLYQKIQEINDYVVEEYSYDPHFDFDILEELTIYTVNLVRMGILDFKLVMTIGEFYALNDIANGKTPKVVDIEDIIKGEEFKSFNKIISDIVEEWFVTHPGELLTLKNIETIPTFGRPANTDFDTGHLLKN